MAKIEMSFLSYSLRRTVDLTIVYPTCVCGECNDFINKKKDYNNLKDYPVLYLLHGMSGDHSTWVNYTSIVRYAEEYNIFVVMISGEDKFYLNQCVYDNYYDFINEELPNFITASFPVSNKREDTFIAGLSMGGYGALRHGLVNYDKYGAIGAFSAPFDKKEIYEIANLLVDDLYELLNKLIKENKKIPPLYLSVGNQDTLLNQNIEFKKLCLRNNVNYTFKIIEGYEHEWALWDLEILEFIKWMPRNDKYKNIKRKV